MAGADFHATDGGGAGGRGSASKADSPGNEGSVCQGAAHASSSMQGPISLNLDALSKRVHITQPGGPTESQGDAAAPGIGGSRQNLRLHSSTGGTPAAGGGATRTDETRRDVGSSTSGGQLLYLDNIVLQKQDRITHDAHTLRTPPGGKGWVADGIGSTPMLHQTGVRSSGQHPFQAGRMEQPQEPEEHRAVQDGRHLGSASRRRRGQHSHGPAGERVHGSTQQPNTRAPKAARQPHQSRQEQHVQQGAESGSSSSSAREKAAAPVPRPHPYYLRPQHVKTNYMCHTPDGWKLHLIRTRQLHTPSYRQHPVLLCPGLGSSGAYSFDLSPTISLADYLASRGWDVWTVELRGNGKSDKPSLGSSRSSTWTIDDYVEKDIPSLVRFILKEARPPGNQVHFLGHSMVRTLEGSMAVTAGYGGMVLLGVMARMDTTAARVRSLTLVGSGLFLEESRWRAFERFTPLLNLMWTVPSGRWLRWYGAFMLGPLSIPFLDELYFAPGNVDVGLARALMRRNFSNISTGVLRQMTTAFRPEGLLSADGRFRYADPARLGSVTAPALFLAGDRDFMCPPEGCHKSFQMLGSRPKRFVCLGPEAGCGSHYGHFDLLMGRRADSEVFPLISAHLDAHDGPTSKL